MLERAPSQTPLVGGRVPGVPVTETVSKVALTGPDVLVRDSKDPSGPILRFDRSAWSIFLGRIKSDNI